jgi:hypothetical protein
MRHLNPQKLHVTYLPGAGRVEPLFPRRYTLTHSDTTGELFLSIGLEYDKEKVSHWYTRFMRDEVLAEWEMGSDGALMVVHCHVSGGVVFGSAGLRSRIFHRELPLALESIRFGDRHFFDAHPHLDQAKVRVLFHAKQARYDKSEEWGRLGDYS